METAVHKRKDETTQIKPRFPGVKGQVSKNHSVKQATSYKTKANDAPVNTEEHHQSPFPITGRWIVVSAKSSKFIVHREEWVFSFHMT